jgi:hypothetical protein
MFRCACIISRFDDHSVLSHSKHCPNWFAYPSSAKLFRCATLLAFVIDFLPLSDRRHNALTGNDLEADWISLRMNERKVTNVDRTNEGVLVTFADGYTFLFQSDFLYMVRLKDGQLVGQEKPDK